MSVKRLDWPPNASPSGDGARVSAFVKIRLEDISFRDLEIRLRHTVAQRLADEGMREELLQQFLGHEAPKKPVSQSLTCRGREPNLRKQPAKAARTAGRIRQKSTCKTSGGLPIT